MVILTALFTYCIVGVYRNWDISDEQEAVLLKWVFSGCVEAVVELILIGVFK